MDRKDIEDLRAALLKTQALVLCLETRIDAMASEIDMIKRENHVERYASSF
jgi:hypothetical protein